MLLYINIQNTILHNTLMENTTIQFNIIYKNITHNAIQNTILISLILKYSRKKEMNILQNGAQTFLRICIDQIHIGQNQLTEWTIG